MVRSYPAAQGEDPPGVHRDTKVVLQQRMNWKFVIDGFMETYHAYQLFPNTVLVWRERTSRS